MTRTAKLENDSNLAIRARTDGEALGRLYELYYDRIYRFCVHRLFDKQSAEDVTSAIFLDVARKIKGFTGPSEVNFRNWLYTIAVTNVNSYIRKTSRRKKLLTAAAAELTKTNTVSDPGYLDWPKLYAAIIKLKPKHQSIVTLRFFEGLEYDQIAEILNVRQTTVRVTLHRILKKLKDHLQSAADGGL